MTKKRYLIVAILVITLLVLSACEKVGPGYGKAITIPPSQLDLANFPDQFLSDDDTNQVLNFNAAFVAPSGYDTAVSTLRSYIQTKMCELVNADGYDCYDGSTLLSGGITGGTITNLFTGSAIIDNYNDVIPLMRCFRMYHGMRDDTVSVNSCPTSYEFVSLLGLIHRVQKPNTIPLYSCYRAVRTQLDGRNSRTYTDHFLSTSVACDGMGTNTGELGYIYTSPSTNTIPVSKCWQGPDDFEGSNVRYNHFASTEGCDGWTEISTWYTLNTCEESDAGNEIDVFGTTEGVIDSKDDFCETPNMINEFYCSMNSKEGYEQELIECPTDTFCIDGECKSDINFDITQTVDYDIEQQELTYNITITNTGSEIGETTPVVITEIKQGIVMNTIDPMPSLGAQPTWTFEKFGTEENSDYDFNQNRETFSSKGIFKIQIKASFGDNVNPGDRLVNKITVVVDGNTFEDSIEVIKQLPPSKPTEGGMNELYDDAVPLLSCFRNYHSVRDDTVALEKCPSTFTFGSLLGMIYTEEKIDTIPLYSCYRTKTTDAVTGNSRTYKDHYISTDVACEGTGTNDGRLGYVFSQPQSGRTKVIRCWSGDIIKDGVWNHKATYSSCGNWAEETIIYTLNSCVDPDEDVEDSPTTTTVGTTTSLRDSCESLQILNEVVCSMDTIEGYEIKQKGCDQGLYCIDGACVDLDQPIIPPPTPFCGDGAVNQASEQCEPPNTATCDSNCQTIITTPGPSGDYQVNIPSTTQPPSTDISGINAVIFGTCTDNNLIATEFGSATCNSKLSIPGTAIIRITQDVFGNYRLFIAGTNSADVLHAVNSFVSGDFTFSGLQSNILYTSVATSASHPHPSQLGVSQYDVKYTLSQGTNFIGSSFTIPDETLSTALSAISSDITGVFRYNPDHPGSVNFRVNRPSIPSDLTDFGRSLEAYNVQVSSDVEFVIQNAMISAPLPSRTITNPGWISYTPYATPQDFNTALGSISSSIVSLHCFENGVMVQKTISQNPILYPFNGCWIQTNQGVTITA